MQTQMTIFDLLRQKDLDEMPEEDMVREVSSRIGIVFQWVAYPPSKYNEGRGEWVAKYKGLRLTVGFDTNVDGEKYIGTGYDYPKEKSGGGAPCEDIDEAVDWFNRVISRYVRKGGQYEERTA